MPAASPSSTFADADPDAGLALRAAGGDAEAVATLLQKHQKRIYNLAFRSLNHAEDAADATQEALLKISRGIINFRGQSRVSTWITRIALNEACTVGRGRARRSRSAAESPDAADRREQHREPAPERRLEAEEAATTLTAALAEVPEQFREALILRDIDKLGYESIAEVLDVPIGTVRSRIFRGRLALRELLLAGGADS